MDASIAAGASVGRRRLALAIALAIIALFLWSSARLAWTRYQLAERAHAVEVDTARVDAENAHLLTQLAYLRGDEGVEKLARESLGWARPGETVVVVVGQTPTPASR